MGDGAYSQHTESKFPGILLGIVNDLRKVFQGDSDCTTKAREKGDET